VDSSRIYFLGLGLSDVTFSCVPLTGVRLYVSLVEGAPLPFIAFPLRAFVNACWFIVLFLVNRISIVSGLVAWSLMC
jgi:hypothetical protein